MFGQPIRSLAAMGGGFTLTGNSPEALLGSMGLQGFNPDDIVKALATTGVAGVDGSSLIGYDLDRLIRVITLSPDNNTPKLQRFNTYNAKALSRQYNVLSSRGRAKGSARAEGQLGVQDASVYSRQSEAIKFVGRTAVVTYELQAAGEKSFGDVKALEVASQLAQMLMDVERDIWHGDNTLNPLMWRGIIQQMNSGSDYKTDLSTKGVSGSGRTTITAGGSLTTAKIRTKTPQILREGGTFTALYCAPEEKEALSSEQDGNSRWYKEDQNSGLVVGMKVDQIAQSVGRPIDIIYDIWLSGIRGDLYPQPLDPADATLFHDKQPAQLSSAPTGAVSSGGNLPVDEYFYGMAAKNEVGEGPIKIQSTGYTTTDANGKVTLTQTHPADTSKIKSYVLYRSTTGGAYGNFRRLKEVAIDTSGATQDIVDDGTIVPGSREAILLNEYMADLGSLANPQAVELARIDLTHRVGLFAMLNTILHAPKHIHRWFNAGGSVADPS